MKKAILETVKNHLDVNKDFLNASEVKNLQEQIVFLEKELFKERHSKYLNQLKEFRQYLGACFDVLMGDACTDETVDIFYQSEFEITFRGKKVTLENGAEVFQGIEELIQTEIDNEEEI